MRAVRRTDPCRTNSWPPLLMAICLRGMTPQETADLTMEMMHSGEVVDLSGVGGVCVDKHSTGGVGDTTTLVLTPLVAACGAKVAKMSGRGPGPHRGYAGQAGEHPRLHGFPFARSVRGAGAPHWMCRHRPDGRPRACGQAPLRAARRDGHGRQRAADRLEHLSKKLAAGAHAIVLDVKTGSGALMQTLEDSVELGAGRWCASARWPGGPSWRW